MEVLKEQMPCLHNRAKKKLKLVHEFYTTVEAGRILEIKWTELQRLIKKNQFKVSCKGKDMMVSRTEIIRYLNQKHFTAKNDQGLK